ncbi:XRE family transcriptional regulator [Sphingomonas sp. VNH70]|uniref:helix-turn-helix domain-containing protein n=1 Tax=Sphingomonas silueang TaxID=3156617 RepID=UPI0032B49F36
MKEVGSEEIPWSATEKPTLPIGERIKARRKTMGLTLQELATRSGLSAPFISQAERNLSVPSLWSLLALAKAMDVDISYFMTIPHSDAIVARADQPRRIQADSSVVYHSLSSDFEGRRMDAMLIHIPPGYAFRTDQRNGEIFRYVIKGELHAVAGDVETILGPGDSMHFDARLSHSIANRSDAPAILLYTGTPSLFRQE